LSVTQRNTVHSITDQPVLLLTALLYKKYKIPAPRARYKQVKITAAPDVLAPEGPLALVPGLVGVLNAISHALPAQPALQVHCNGSVQFPFLQFEVLHLVNGVAPSPVSSI